MFNHVPVELHTITATNKDGVRLDGTPEGNKYPSITTVRTVRNRKGLMERALLLSISNATYFNRKKFDLFWEAPGVSQFNVFDFNQADELFRMGYDHAQSQVDVLLTSLSKLAAA